MQETTQIVSCSFPDTLANKAGQCLEQQYILTIGSNLYGVSLSKFGKITVHPILEFPTQSEKIGLRAGKFMFFLNANSMKDKLKGEQFKLPDSNNRALIVKVLDDALRKVRKERQRRLLILNIKLGGIVVVIILMLLLPGLLGKKLTCEEMDTAQFYEKIHYYTRSPALAHPCDSTSPFWSP